MPARSLWALALLLGIRPAAALPQSPENFRIAGIVVDGNTGIPLPRAGVSVTFSSDRSMRLTTLSSADGRFVFNDLPPGKYILAGNAKGYQSQMFQQHETFTTAIVIGKDLPSENLVLRLFPLGSISGVVSDEFSDPVRYANVRLLQYGLNAGNEGLRMQRQVSTDDQGHYRFAGLAPGRYYVAVSAQPWYAQHNTVPPEAPPESVPGSPVVVRPQPNVEQNTNLDVAYPLTYFPRETDLGKATPITLRPGEGATADVSLQPLHALHLRLTAPGIDLSQNVGVRITEATPGTPQGFATAQVMRTNKDSVEVAGVVPGNFVVNLDLNTNAGMNERQTLQQRINVSRDGEIALADLTSPSKVGGHITLPSQTSFRQGAGIGIRNRDTGAMSTTGISPDGKFEFRNAAFPPGMYDLALLGAPGFYVDHLESAGAKASGPTFELLGTAGADLTVYIARGMARVEGVAQREGSPVGGAMILLVPQNFTGDSFSVRRDQSDSDGTFTLLQVPPGIYTVMAIENGWEEQWANPTVVKGWMAQGEIIYVSPDETNQVKVKVQ
jgi:Carboxypeptidase regulatory-like domain